MKLRQDHKPGKKVRKKDLWKLDELRKVNPGFDGFDNIIDFLESFLEDLKQNGHLDDNSKRTLSVIRHKSGPGVFDSDPEARTIEAELTYGRYNRVADHNDTTAYASTSHESPYTSRRESERDRDTVAETRLHFLAHVPTSTTRSAFFVLHSYGRNSVKTRFKDAFNRFIAKHYDSSSTPFALDDDRRKSSYKLELNTVAGKELIDELKSSKIVGFEVRKQDMNVPEYMSESTDLGDDSEGNLIIQYTSDEILSSLNTKNESVWERIRNEKYPLGELVDEDPSRANAIVKVSDNNTRKINISRDEVRMESMIDASKLEYDSDGRVKVEKVGEFSREHLNEKLQEIGATTLRTDSLLT